MTPYQVRRVVRAYARRLKAQHQIAVSAAWHTERFARTRRLPDLQTVLGVPQKPLPRSEQKAVLLAWAKSHNASLSGAIL